MGKYIIELEDNESVYKTIIKKDPMIQAFELLSPIPYTEPDLEQVRIEAYEKGYHAGYSKYLNKSYEDGLKDAWEAARKIGSNSMHSLKEMGFDFARCVVADYNPSWFVVKNYSASECIEKIRQYEREQEKIKRGDEVITQSGETIIVTHRLEDGDFGWLDGMGLDGRVYTFLEKNCTKTGKHYSEIAEFFQKMGEKNG